MKTFLLLVSAFVLWVPTAQAWEKILDCDQGTLVVDSRMGESVNYGIKEFQVVLRGNALSYFRSRNAIPSYDVSNEKNEAVVRISRDLSHTGFYFYASMYMQYGQPETMAYFDLKPDNGGMTLTFNQGGQNYTNYYFRNCSFLGNP